MRERNCSDQATARHRAASSVEGLRQLASRAVMTVALSIATACASHAMNVCKVTQEGEHTVTYYCVTGYTCNLPQWKCDPGPEALARQERNRWSGDKNDCDSAGEFERQTAAWYYACVLNTKIARTSDYKPKIDPMELSRRAKAGCRGNADFDKCVGGAKQTMILAADPSIRDACAGLSGLPFDLCVDRRYVYGPQTPQDRLALRNKLRDRLFDASKIDGGPPGDRSHVDTGPKPHGCPPGYGMKPDRKAFGAWTCQPLGVVFLGFKQSLPPGSRRPDQTEAAAAIEAFENRLDEVTFDAAESGARSAGGQMSESAREQCLAEAFAAVRAVFKGGVPEVSKSCRAVAGAGREELLRYAYSHVDTSDPSLEELLASLAERTDPANKERQADCLHSKLPAEELRKCLLKSVER